MNILKFVGIQRKFGLQALCNAHLVGSCLELCRAMAHFPGALWIVTELTNMNLEYSDFSAGRRFGWLVCFRLEFICLISFDAY